MQQKSLKTKSIHEDSGIAMLKTQKCMKIQLQISITQFYITNFI